MENFVFIFIDIFDFIKLYFLYGYVSVYIYLLMVKNIFGYN